MLPEDNVVDDMVIDVWCARAKRKNRIAQLKRTIRRLSEESEHLKKVLAIRIVDDVVQADREALEYAQKHLSVERRMPEISRDNESGILLCAIKRPLVTWDGKEIITQKP